METKNLNDLNPNPKNPRSISKRDFASLKKSIQKFGDMSGIVYNTKTGRLVGGHMRQKSFMDLEGDKKVVITQRFDKPNAVGTVAVGYVTYNGEFYGYRETYWDEDIEAAAGIAANRIQGDFDLDLLGEMDQWLKDNNPDLLEYTGQDSAEIARLLGDSIEKEPVDDELNNMSIKLDDNQYVVVERAIAHMKAKQSFANEANSDFDGNAIYYICSEWLNAQAA